jgi:hypothetical protein
MEFDSKAKVGALVQRARAFMKKKTAEEAAEDDVERPPGSLYTCSEYSTIRSCAAHWQCYRQDEDHMMGSRDITQTMEV